MSDHTMAKCPAVVGSAVMFPAAHVLNRADDTGEVKRLVPVLP